MLLSVNGYQYLTYDVKIILNYTNINLFGTVTLLYAGQPFQIKQNICQAWLD